MDIVKASREFQRSRKVSKSDAAAGHIPSSISVPEKDVSKNPEFCIMVKSALFRRKEANQFTSSQSWICSRTSDTNIGALRDRSEIE